MMKKVTKVQFKEIYFKYGKAEDGWGQSYWDSFYEPSSDNELSDYESEKQVMRYMVELPKNEQESRMMIVTDHKAKEHRLFFLATDEEEGLFDSPSGKYQK